MEIRAGQVVVNYVEHGTGLPVLVLHGAGVDHREAEACFEPVFDDLAGLRRIYLDLPGMGRTAAPETLCSAADVLDALLNFVEEATGVRRTSSPGTRRAPTTPRRWQPSAPPWLLVWHWSVRCCQDYVTSPSTAASPARVRSVTTSPAATS